jgi:hypothetical protein
MTTGQETSVSFFEQVVAASGLSRIIARAAVTRACLRAGVDPTQIDRMGLRSALPFLENTLRLYVPAEATERLRALELLTW